MNNATIWSAVFEALLTIGLVTVVRRISGSEHTKAVTWLAGFAFPFLTASAAIIFTLMQPVHKAAWSNLGLIAMLGIALAALPLCLGVSWLFVHFSKKPS